jgi:Domain of unknown function (DUF397)
MMSSLNMAQDWRKSSRCDSVSCVEVARGVAGAMMRDSKESDGAILKFGFSGWGLFVEQIRVDGFDPR